MAIRMARGYGNWLSLRDEAVWYDRLTSEGSLTLAVGEHVGADAHFDRFTFPQRAVRVATVENETGRYEIAVQGNHRGDRYSGGTWATIWVSRVS